MRISDWSSDVCSSDLYYTVAELLACEAGLSGQFIHGRFATLYLSPKDYHRIHMPIDAKLIEMIYVPGKLYSVQPTTARIVPHLFARNERQIGRGSCRDRVGRNV